jgi:hypothetical protein
MATLLKGKTFTNGELVTPATIHQLVDAATISGIVNADIAANAAIADTKLATISTANKVSQSAVANLTTDLAGKAASIHQHAIADTTGLQTALDGKAASSHTHTIANVTGLQTALDGKQASGSYAPATGIAQSAVSNLTTDLAGKAASSHTHDDRYYTETEIDTKLSGLPVSGHTHDDRYYTETEMNTLLAGKQASGSYAASSHSHAATDITSGTLAIARIPTGTTATTVCIGNDSRLSDSRFPTYHTHSADQITSGNLSNDRLYATSANAVNNLVLRDGSGNFSAGTITANLTGTASGNALSSHTHTVANVTGLQTALDGKQASGSYVTNGGNVSSIQRVTAMPATPSANTLYIVIP